MNMNHDVLTCMELVELITEYLEGSLSPADQTRFETHLHECSGCHNYLEQMIQTVRLTGKLTEDRIAPVALDEMLRTFQNWKNSQF